MYNYSIILPYYDKYDLFVKAVNSVPDRADIQIIIVDNSKKTLLQEQVPQKQNALVTYTTSDNTKGAGHARNVGLTKVQGNYILFCDADDYFAPEAFESFDKYLDAEFDIVFFHSSSISLKDGKMSDRHYTYNKLIDLYNATGKEDRLRYRYEAPWGKLYHSSFVLENNKIRFEELRVNNDAWFSLMAGHYAKTIMADKSVVYVITEGDKGTSLTKMHSIENFTIRYDCAIKTNLFLKSVGYYDMRIRLLGFIRIAFCDFGLKVGFVFLLKAIRQRLSIF